jgi:hypothetical protein
MSERTNQQYGVQHEIQPKLDRRTAARLERDREIMRALIKFRAPALRELAKH